MCPFLHKLSVDISNLIDLQNEPNNKHMVANSWYA